MSWRLHIPTLNATSQWSSYINFRTGDAPAFQFQGWGFGMYRGWSGSKVWGLCSVLRERTLSVF